MKRQITLHNRVVHYGVRKSTRAKRLRLAVYNDGSFIVTTPQGFAINGIEKYIISKSQWVISKLDFFEGLNKKQKLSFGSDGYEKYRDKALETVLERLAELNQAHYKYKYKKVSIKNQKTRWGSCSKHRNLNFNYKILFLPPKIRDYIIVHELCHLKEFNHSQKFWRLVAKAMPDYKSITNELKIKGLILQ